MDPAPGRPGRLGQGAGDRHDVVLEAALELIDPLEPDLPGGGGARDRLGRVLRDHPELGLGGRQRRLHLERPLEAGAPGEQCTHAFATVPELERAEERGRILRHARGPGAGYIAVTAGGGSPAVKSAPPPHY